MTPQLFFIVGVQKGGTTSLFKYLKEHPDIYMPDEKEAPFFSKNDVDAESWSKYKTSHLSPPNSEKLAGTASPQYMCDHRVPERMAQYAPEAKIIIVLRDPIERAASHYKMVVRWGRENRSFDEAITSQLNPHSLEIERVRSYSDNMENEHDSYVCRGEYKRIIDRFLRFYPEQVHVILSEDLKNNRKDTLQSIFRFLCVDDKFTPVNISMDFHKSDGGSVGRIGKRLFYSPIARTIARFILSKRVRANIKLKYFTFMSGDSRKITVGVDTYRRLRDHYIACNTGLPLGTNQWYKKCPDSNGAYLF